MIKKFLILGFVRSGTTGFAHYLNFLNKTKNLEAKSKAKYKKKFEAFIKYRRFKFLKNRFLIFTPWEKKFFSPIKKKELLSKKVLLSHYFNKKIFKIFKNREIVLIIREPMDVISSLINFTTKKSVISYNSNYKIDDPKKLVLNKKIINNHIKSYEKFYSNFYNSKYSSKIKVLKFKTLRKIKFNSRDFDMEYFKKNRYHSSIHLKEVRKYLIENYDFKKSEKIYKRITKLKQFELRN